MRTENVGKREAQIKGILSDHSDIFREKKLDRFIYSTSNSICAPYSAMRGQRIGIPLKDNVGFISIFESIDNGEPTTYVYKFFSDEYECKICKRDNKKELKEHDFNFHYDGCKEDKPHKPHLTVMYPSIRYLSTHISLETFLEFIKETFFKRDQGEYIRKDDNLWCGRIS